MSSIPVHTGSWHDWSTTSALGVYSTFSVRDTLYITGATAVFLAFVGGEIWSIYAYVLHQRLSTRPIADPITLQHRLIYRNDSTATAAAIDAFWVYWYWKPWKLIGSKGKWRYLWPCHRRSRRRAKNVGLRTCYLIIPALLVFAASVAAGIFASHITRPAYKGNAVLVQDRSTQGYCGITQFDDTIEGVSDFDVKASNDTRAAVAYARSCYSPASGVIDSVACSLFTKTKLEYFSTATTCPFGDQEQAFSDSICNFNNNNQAHHLQTRPLNSHEDFGINSPPRNRVELTKYLVCSPLNFTGFNVSGPAHGVEADANITVTDYMFGGVPNVADYTFEYNSASKYDNVPFEVFSLLYNATGPHPWIPVSNITRTDADVTIVFIAPNSIVFRKPSTDPIFHTTYPLTEMSSTGERFNIYTPDYPVSVIGCAEQYSICNPNLKSNSCTSPNGQVALSNLIQDLDLNKAQLVTAYRMIYMIADGTTYSSINGIGPDALRIWNTVYNFVAPGVPKNQWQIEVEGWLETTLAKWQAFMVEYASNIAYLGSHGHVGFPISDDTLAEEWKSQCGSQKISNVGAWQNVSVFGFTFTWATGVAIVIFSWSLKCFVRGQRKWRNRADKLGPIERRIAWNIDGKFQQQRVALHTVGYQELTGGEGDIPFLEKEGQLFLPFFAGEEKVHGRQEADTIYVKHLGSSGNVGHHPEGIELPQRD